MKKFQKDKSILCSLNKKKKKKELNKIRKKLNY